MPACRQGPLRALRAQGILVRHFNASKLRDKLRISVGTPEQNQRLLEAIKGLLSDASVSGEGSIRRALGRAAA